MRDPRRGERSVGEGAELIVAARRARAGTSADGSATLQLIGALSDGAPTIRFSTALADTASALPTS